MLTRRHSRGNIASVPDTITVSQLVGYNLARIRKALGLSQEQAAERIAPYLGSRWSKTVYSLAERSYDGKRIRQFTAAELAAFALGFGVPAWYFYLPPKPDDRNADGALIGDRFVPWAGLFDIVIGGEQRGAIQLRLDELPISEQPGNAHALAALGIATWERRNPAGEVSRYDAQTSEFKPVDGAE